ncbi:MAG: biotin/lipoyl-containing protein [Cetobacterium sp.]
MIKVYKVKIGEKVYEVEVESVTEVNGTISAPTSSTPAPAAVASAPAPAGNGTKVEAPMQGLVVSVDVTVGANVKAGDTLLVLEAMKMENPIVSPVNGVVQSITVNKGDTVDGGTVVVTIA